MTPEKTDINTQHHIPPQGDFFHKAVFDGGVIPPDSGLEIAKEFIKKWEGLKLEAYKCSAGVWTIGYGHIKTTKQGMKITAEDANKLFDNDIIRYYDAVCAEVGKSCNQYQIASFTSFAFNLGISALKKSTLLKVVKKNPQNLQDIEAQFMRWIYANNVTVKGLYNRRVAEFELYKKS